jgi:hypothetical protein
MRFFLTLLFILLFQLKGRTTGAAQTYTDTLKTWEVVINEIMADPDPLAGTVLYPEYVELYNTKESPVNLKNWKFCAGTVCKTLPDVSIPADSFLVLAALNAVKSFPSGVNVTGIAGFPALVNSGQTLQLQSSTGNLVHVISYSDDWYDDPLKKYGGYSLEQIDAANPCGGGNNWKAAVHAEGCTPGRRNSTAASNLDREAPELLRVNVLSPNKIEAIFSEPLDSTTFQETVAYMISELGHPDSIALIKPTYRNLVLHLGDSLKKSVMYTLTVGKDISDCAGNALAMNNSARFAIPAMSSPNDVVINEVLFDPKAGGVDFVEIYNRSQKVVDLRALYLCHYDTLSKALSAVKQITSTPYLFFPGQYLILTEDAETVKHQYRTEDPRAFLSVPELPALYTDEGNIALKTATELIDHFTYNKNMHFALLKDTKGISLERVNFERFTNDVTNWHSASSSVDFATPGYRNSQFLEQMIMDEEVKLVPQIFSPDADGYEDQVTVQFHFDKPALSATILIFDCRGRLVRTLVNNDLIGPEGSYSWDGINDEREKERKGMYVIYIKTMDLSGAIKQYKKVCVLGGKN